jgi:hypothetical protein
MLRSKNRLGVWVGTLAPAFLLGVASAQPLVINEVDYDQIGTDTAEFVEIFNPTAGPVSLAGLDLIFVNGANNLTYRTVDLGVISQIPAGGYLLVASSAVVAPTGVDAIRFAAANDNIQNGSPDGIVLVNRNSVQVLDAVCYEGAMTAVTLAGFSGPVSLVAGTAIPSSVADTNTAVASLSRFPNGVRTGIDASDWAVIDPTPGYSNGGQQPTCDSLDFNNDGNIDPSDVDAYFSILGEGSCLPVGTTCNDLDFNNDGNIDPADVDAYFSILGEGPCLQ